MTQTLTQGTASVTQPQLTVDAARNRINSTGFVYDAAGNMTNDSLHTYSFNAENEITAVDGGSTASYAYDGNRWRVQKTAAGASTTYVYSGPKVIAEYAGGVLSKEYIYSGGNLLATLAGNVLSYQYSDQLSTRLETDSSGAITRSFGHFPFGESWYETGAASKWKFTSYERDSESNLDYALNRFDSSRLGRFMSPDLLSGSITDPQSLNHYSYVGNDPVNFADQSGLGRQILTEPYDAFAASGYTSFSYSGILVIGAGAVFQDGGCVFGCFDGFGLGAYFSAFFSTGESFPGGTGEDGGQIVGEADPCTLNPKKSGFVAKNLPYAQQIATQLNTEPANILGLSALETRFGESHIVQQTNNYFSLTVGPAFKGTIGTYKASTGYSFGIYPDPGFLTSGLSFANSYQGKRVFGLTDPNQFAQALTTGRNPFNSEFGTAGKYVNAINQVKSLTGCGSPN